MLGAGKARHDDGPIGIDHIVTGHKAPVGQEGSMQGQPAVRPAGAASITQYPVISSG